ncbi:hypothetical protein D9M69_654950 [compost metagenome]
MQINRNEEEGCSIGVHIAQQPAGIDIAHDLFDGIERNARISRIMHCQHNTGNDLRNEHKAQNATKRVHIVQVTRRRIGNKGIIDQAR